jgi:hypothetical protein
MRQSEYNPYIWQVTESEIRQYKRAHFILGFVSGLLIGAMIGMLFALGVTWQ